MTSHFKASRIPGFSGGPRRLGRAGAQHAVRGSRLRWYNPAMIAGTTTPLPRRFASPHFSKTAGARLLAAVAAWSFYIEGTAQTTPAEPRPQPPAQAQPTAALPAPTNPSNPAQIPAISQPAPVAMVMAPQPPVGEWMAAARLGPAQASFFVQEVGTGSPWVDINARDAQNPASLMKLLTTYAALESLGPAATFRTTVWATGQRSGGQPPYQRRRRPGAHD
jgi:D-alanyl-D-alanine carboxypeptidase/D-alanyl-D-alanine-endopeptidase (penicillin-binding protein 4)